MRFIIQGTQILDHERFLEAGVHARDLWEWGMLYAGKHETDGHIPMAAVLASAWGYGGKANIKAANRLVEVGLWERTDRGFLVLRWTEQGNKTRAELEVARAADRAKKRRQRSKPSAEAKASFPESRTIHAPSCPGGTPQGTPAGVLNCVCVSKDLGSDPRRSDQPDRSPTPPATPPVEVGPAPDWWSAAVATAEQAVGAIDQPGARWLEYDASRERKGWARSQRDAVGWLTAVARAERTRARAGPRGDAAVTRQPFDPEAPWIKLGDTGS